jgi:RNA methyltransferase, TrmH family
MNCFGEIPYFDFIFKKTFRMLSKNQIKEIKSLESKKERTISGLFIAEGKKLISEITTSDINIETIITTEEFSAFFHEIKGHLKHEIIVVQEDEIKKISQLKTPQGSLAICKIPYYTLQDRPAENNLVFCLEDIQDPGNLGTIVRLADWFGINDIVCSPSSADIYNPKVVQATMGAICRVRVHYTPLIPFLVLQNHWHEPVFGTFLDGENIYKSPLPSHGIITLGNEGKGISDELGPYIDRRITIPCFHTGDQKPDSLNVSVAASIIISEFKRRNNSGK